MTGKMELVQCHNCGHSVSPRARQCPNCKIKCPAQQMKTCKMCQNVIQITDTDCPICGEPQDFVNLESSGPGPMLNADINENQKSKKKKQETFPKNIDGGKQIDNNKPHDSTTRVRLPSIDYQINRSELSQLLKRNNLYSLELNPSSDGLGGSLIQVPDANNCITDTNTGLMWYKDPIVSSINKSIYQLPLVQKITGFNDWHVANIVELHSLLYTPKIKELEEESPWPKCFKLPSFMFVVSSTQIQNNVMDKVIGKLFNVEKCDVCKSKNQNWALTETKAELRYACKCESDSAILLVRAIDGDSDTSFLPKT